MSDAVPAISVVGLSKSYGKSVALDNVSLVVASGACAGLVGANGAGKSTLMSCLGSQVLPGAGRIDVCGYRHNTSAGKRALGFVPEQPDLFRMLTVRDHMEFTARLYRLTDWQGRAQELLESFGLLAFEGSSGALLSQGTRRKTALAMTLLRGASVVLLDEPFNGLDPQAQQELREQIGGLRESGTTVVISSHRLQELEHLADTFLFLRDGSLTGAGTLPELQALTGQPTTASLEDLYFQLATGA